MLGASCAEVGRRVDFGCLTRESWTKPHSLEPKAPIAFAKEPVE